MNERLLIVTVGLPRSGKTTWARQQGVPIVNPDSIMIHEHLSWNIKNAVEAMLKTLNRVLDDLHPTAVLGFVLPAIALDGQSYAGIRERLARRFSSLEFTHLPDKVFPADTEVALLIATEPIPHDVTRVAYRRVKDSDWHEFSNNHGRVSFEASENVSLEQSRYTFKIPQLNDVWAFLQHNPILDDVAEIHRGIEWKLPLDPRGKNDGHRSRLVREKETPAFKLGVPPQAKFNAFETPKLAYLSDKPEDRRGNAWQLKWNKPKAIVNKSRRSRGAWKLSAFADHIGVCCYQTFDGVWPAAVGYDEVILAAILNSPLANAFVSTREERDIHVKTIRSIPMPVFTAQQRERLHDLVRQYENVISGVDAMQQTEAAESLLKQIDALVLDGYRMPANLERQILDFFAGSQRPVAHNFSDYVPPDFEPNFSLSNILSREFMSSNFGELLKTSTRH